MTQRPQHATRPEPATLEFAFEPLYRAAGAVFGITPATARLQIDGGELRVRFGPWRVRTTLENIAAAEVAGPYSVPKTIGPAHLSLKDRGLTFATNHRRGVCIRFARPVPGLAPTDRIRHPSLTVTVDDPDRLAALLAPHDGGLG